MMPHRLHDRRLPRLLERWRGRFDLRLPRAGSGGTAFGPAPPDDDPGLLEGTVLESPAHTPPHRPGLPPHHPDGEARPAATARQALLFGVRPCDAAALELLPAVTAAPSDAAQPLVVTVACAHPHSSCFCDAVGGGPADGRGSDLLVVPAGGDLLLDPQNGRGLSLIELASDLLAPAGLETLGAAEETVQAARERLALVGPPGPSVEPSQLFPTPAWREFVESCRGCGVCVRLCPTAADDDLEAEGGPRGLPAPPVGSRTVAWREGWLRRWMERQFGRAHAVGSRLRCVGCGRCVRYCPAALDVRTVLHGFPGA